MNTIISCVVTTHVYGMGLYILEYIIQPNFLFSNTPLLELDNVCLDIMHSAVCYKDNIIIVTY